MATLRIAGALLLAGCAGKHAAPAAADQGPQQTLMRARNLCRDFGYTPGTMEFARCAQTEYDRMALAVPQPMPPPVAPPPQAAQSPPPAAASQPAPQASSDDDWLINWLKRPPVCGQAACSVR